MLGVITGMLAGYYGGATDTLVSRLTEIIMAFPLLLFLIALSATVGDRLNDITFGGLLYPGVFSLVLVITLFSWFYPARIIRSQVLSLREKEFVEAARMVGSSNFRIMRSHLLPHLVGTIIVYGTVTIAINILLESTLSFLGVGLPGAERELGQAARPGRAVLHDPALADRLAGPDAADRDAVVQPARRRPARRARPARDRSNFPDGRSVLDGERLGIPWSGGAVDPEVRREEGSMKRRPGLWLALTALVAGVSMLGLAGCGQQQWRLEQ